MESVFSWQEKDHNGARQELFYQQEDATTEIETRCDEKK